MDIWQLFIRHAHRDLEDRSLDNGLSARGKKQCEDLVAYLESLRPARIPTHVFSSPKRRCVETAEYIAAWANLKVEVDHNLDEQGPHESDRDFLHRIRDWKTKNHKLTRLCFVTHGDVLPILGRLYGSYLAEVKKGDLFFVENQVLAHINAVRASES